MEVRKPVDPELINDFVNRAQMVIVRAHQAHLAMPDQKLISMAMSDLEALRKLGSAIYEMKIALSEMDKSVVL